MPSHPGPPGGREPATDPVGAPGRERPPDPGADRKSLDRLAARVQVQGIGARAQSELAEQARNRAIEMRRKARAVRAMLNAGSPTGTDLRRAAFEALPTPAALVGRSGRILSVNRPWRERFGTVLGVRHDLAAGWASAGGDPAMVRALGPVLDGGAATDLEVDLAGGRRALVQLAPTPAAAGAALVVLIDITEQHQRAEALLFEATHDPLTGLANRAFLTRAIESSLAAGRRYGQRFGLVYLDLDSFKPLNDRLGHAAGDHLLAAVARRWGVLVRPPDVLARVGGDEFVVLVTRIEADGQLDAVGTRLADALTEPFTLQDDGEVALTVTAGVAEPSAGMTVEEAVAAADHAMYTNKRMASGGPLT